MAHILIGTVKTRAKGIATVITTQRHLPVNRQVNLPGNEGRAIVELRQELGQHPMCTGLALPFPEELPPIEDLASSHDQHAHRRVRTTDMDAVDIDILPPHGREFAPLAQRLDLDVR